MAVHWLMECAVIFHASDIHIDYRDGYGEIYFRVKGYPFLYTRVSIPYINDIIGRIKVISAVRLDINDRSQDGSFIHQACHSQINVRVATAPAVFGESVVCRLFIAEGSAMKFDLNRIGMSEDDIRTLKRALHHETGLILVSGPTGAGKTTTLYSCLTHLMDGTRVIVTLEDPVEIIIPGIRQIRVQSEYGYGFSSALRGVMRQDPDVIMVGEIRDTETATLAVQAALTGHLVLATIHAPSALEIIDRLHALGVNSSSCASVITLLMSQRRLKNTEQTIVFELIEFSQQLRSTLLTSHGSHSLREIVRESGALLLRDRIGALHAEGYITKEEMNAYVR
jgi:type II secretory ATPase GspE/PulE/Tfp pilus assembly ATPase PilB-like protein